MLACLVPCFFTLLSFRFYASECKALNFTAATPSAAEYYSASDLDELSKYQQICPYFDSCGLVNSGKSVCENTDTKFSFVGYIGKIVEIPANLADPDGIYKVTFNDGRTTYGFKLASLEMQEPDYNYEMWFVQRTPYDFVIQQKKPFKVTSPKCTYDFVNSRYFPYAILDGNGEILTQSDAGYDGVIDKPSYVDEEVFYERPDERRGRKLGETEKEKQAKSSDAKSKREEAAKNRPKVTAARNPKKKREKEKKEEERRKREEAEEERRSGGRASEKKKRGPK